NVRARRWAHLTIRGAVKGRRSRPRSSGVVDFDIRNVVSETSGEPIGVDSRLRPCQEASMLSRTSVILALAVTLLAGSAWAHHNMSALFDFNDRVTVSGTLTKLDSRNPHIYV